MSRTHSEGRHDLQGAVRNVVADATRNRHMSGAIEIRNLLGGAERTSTRPRGFIEWAPRAATRTLLDQVEAVLEEYAEYLPLTVRQIFYRLVGARGYEKTEQAYGRLCEHLVKARRAGLVEFSSIRDDGGTALEPSAWESADEFIGACRRQAASLTLDRSAGQKTRLCRDL
jgi:hypothetical protein